MYHHRTLVCNKDVNSVTATSSTAHRCRSLGIAFAAIAVLMLTGPGLFAQPVEGSDGLTDHEWSTIQDEISQGYRGTARYRGVVVVDSTARNAVFGMRSMYRRNQAVMHLWGRTVDWAINHKDHAATRIWLATYSGTIPGDNDGMAAYEYLVDSMGFNPDSIHVAALSTIDTGDFTGYDVVLQTFWYPPARNAVNVLDQNVPFVTVSVAQAEMMGIGTGDYFEMNLLDSVWIQDTGHEITSPWEPGVLDFQQTLWTDAFYVGGNGVALVTLDAALHYPPVECKIGRTHSVAFGSIATVDVTLASGSYWFDMAGFDLLLAYDTSLLEFAPLTQNLSH